MLFGYVQERVMYSGGACTELPWHEPLPMPLHQHLRAFHRFRRGQGKHDFAVHMQGACSHRCCVESPRASGQRVPAGDRTAPVNTGGEASGRAAMCSLGSLQQRRYAVNVCKGVN
eukprot:CAMPEP_0204529180 /NCGR_PEP_ID=MMETSP0661-20131031/9917_1 /ASSEMBLY_ACC=CAM_ASM_000606 /TAXON_ID=109239 /ORGANISM="Alexandrium margalefi, Strain AMGDE01CS-322" /LENGTH=114 /DNA_ID=CAMNT_0051535191 /DNA_START=421 /DNA_END=765 /DNA_ORIENTATION=+